MHKRITLLLSRTVWLLLVFLATLTACTRDPRPTRTPRLPLPTGSPISQSTTSPIPSLSPTSPSAISHTQSPTSTPPPSTYVVRPGDTLGAIAARFGIDIADLIAANNIANPNLLQVGQTLQLPSTEVIVETALAERLLPDSEFVNGPAYVDFDLVGFVSAQGGYLADHYENVGRNVLSGAEIVRLAAHHYSVGPRLLLTLLEMKSGWVTNPAPTADAIAYPLGRAAGGANSLSWQLAWAADRLNQGYYDWRGRGITYITWPDGTATGYGPDGNAATAGLAYFFSRGATKPQWETWLGDGPDGFTAAYRRLFGDPFRNAIEPLLPDGTPQPTLALPWAPGELWYYTGGPHGGWGDGSAWSALDFVPDEGYLGCQRAASWATAAAPGVVIYSRDGEVLIDLDGDGHEETGWVLFYLHVAAEGRIEEGSRVLVGDRIGHPSCEGGYSESSHLHFGRRFNGEWIAADGPLPLILSGWRAYSDGAAYDGTLVLGGETRTAREARQPDLNGLLAP